MVTPESHVEVKPSHDSLPSEYNPPLPSGSFGSSDSHYSYHPPGCIPTPVLIAQKIAESQSGGSADTISSSLHRSSSLETENPPRYSTDHHSKQGPPTSVKPTRFPPNISVILGSKEHHGQNVGNVNIHERKAQMLANLSGTSHQLLQQEPQQVTEPQKARNIPTRSISFKDPSPDKSRMEALPPRHSYHGISQHKQAQPAPPMDHNKRRTNSLFRPQGITVQFGGRGASDESRKEALRKLGLLKEF
uniref:Proline and serine rich 2 n=1 Tax=Cynoglossus semilaevis TaxID=244447 RepID=A0A3P8UUF1_CYNSE